MLWSDTAPDLLGRPLLGGPYLGLLGSTRTSASAPIHHFDAARGNLADVELITADYVAWYKQQRLMHCLGRISPAEAEAEYYDQMVASQPAGS